MAGVRFPGQVPVDLDIYKSSYMVNYKPYGKHKYTRVTPQERAKLQTQLREKEFHRPSASPNPKLEDGYPAFESPYMTAKDLGRPGFFPPLPRLATAEGARGLASACPAESAAARAASVPPAGPGRPRRSALSPCLRESERQPAAAEGEGYILLPGCLCPSHRTVKVPVLYRWGPLMPFYQ